MTYSEKLRDPRWITFRERFKRSRVNEGDAGPYCDDCGENTASPLHVHHKVYVSGREPWEYDFEDMRLICEECHDIIHDAETDARGFVRTLEPHQCMELSALLDALKMAQGGECVKAAMAHAKNAARAVFYKEGGSEAFR